MKSIKLSLAVLMLAAAFTACTKEEFAPTQDLQQSEFVGAELIGSDLSANFIRGGETKVDANGNFVKGDEAGMAWLVATGYSTPQTEANVPDVSQLFANHLFVKGDTDFTTYGNVYKGWHFSYYPYTYMSELGTNMGVIINPKQTSKFSEDIFTKGLYLSALQFLTAEDNLDDSGRKLVNTNLDLLSAVKTIKVVVKPDASLQNEALKSMKINKVELSVNDANIKPFPSSTKVFLGLKRLPTIVKDPGTEAYNYEETVKNFYDSMNNVWANALNNPSNKIETNVDVEGLNLSGEQDLRFFTLPYNGAVAKELFELKVYTQAGYFTVKYVPTDSRYYNAAIDGPNNAFFEKLSKAYELPVNGSNAGYLRNWDMEKAEIGSGALRMKLEFILTADMFQEDLQVIRSESEWNEAVKIADALELEEPEFVIGKTKISNTTYKEWAFTDYDEDGNLINLPKEGVLTVVSAGENGQGLILDKQGATWPDNDNFIVSTEIKVWNDLYVNSVMTTSSSTYKIKNAAKIYAGPLSQIGTKPDVQGTGARFENQMAKSDKTPGISGTYTGTVVVDYGAYVYPIAGKKGIISYDVESTSIADIDMINKLISLENIENRFGYAGINTLNVKTVLDINARAKYGVAEEDRYGSEIEPEELLADLSNGITVNLQGGSLVNKLAGLNTTVHKVVAQSGENIIDDVVATNIVVNANATLKVNNTKTTAPKTYFTPSLDNATSIVGTINNDGTLEINNAYLVVSTVDNDKNAKISINNGGINYTSTYTQNGSAFGPININQPEKIYVSTLAEFKNAITRVQAGSANPKKVELSADINLLPTVDVNGNTSYEAINLNGVILNGHGFTVSTLNKVADGLGKGVFTTNSGEINDVVFNASNTQYDVVITSSTNKVTISGCTFSAATHYTMKNSSNKYTSKRAIYGTGLNQDVIVEDCEFNTKGYAFNISLANGVTKTATFDNCKLNGWMSGVYKYEFYDCTFGKSGDYADFVPYGAAKFDGCTFNTGFAVSLADTQSLEFVDSCKYDTNVISAPHHVKWSFSGDASVAGDRTVKVGQKTWKSSNISSTTVEAGTINWIQQ